MYPPDNMEEMSTYYYDILQIIMYLSNYRVTSGGTPQSRIFIGPVQSHRYIHKN